MRAVRRGSHRRQDAFAVDDTVCAVQVTPELADVKTCPPLPLVVAISRVPSEDEASADQVRLLLPVCAVQLVPKLVEV